MSYDQWRAIAIRNVYASTIKALMEEYRPGRPTVVLLPGGMGSQLDRSLVPYTGRNLPPFEYDAVWIDPGILFNQDALTLEIDDRGRDKGQHVIVPNGPLRFLVKAYDQTASFCRAQGWNFVAFGFDWRRSIVENAGYLEEFLRLFRETALRKHNENPLPRTTLLAHSQGGLVAKLLLHRIVDVPAWLDKVITVATPYYGTWSHQRRYFVGETPLNALHGASRVSRIIASLPGPYILMFLDQATFERDGGRIGLDAYPITDADTGAPTDPYDLANLDRYTPWVNRTHLNDARLLRGTLTGPLPAPVQSRLYNIRSRLDGETPTRLAWRWIDSSFDPDSDPSPIIAASTAGGGDGTVPGWSAWLADAPAANRIELQTAAVHMELMEHVEVLGIAQGLIEQGQVPAVRETGNELFGGTPATASAADVEQLMRDVHDSRAARNDPRIQDPAIWRGLMQELKK